MDIDKSATDIEQVKVRMLLKTYSVNSVKLENSSGYQTEAGKNVPRELRPLPRVSDSAGLR